MRSLDTRVKIVVIVLIMGIAVSLNFLTLLQALPESQKIDSGCCAPSGTLLAKDFSAFYFGAWNLFHNSSKIYSLGSSSNATFLGIRPHPETFKYLPAFLILVSPFLLLSYRSALILFDLVQFIALFLIAFLICELLKGRNIAIIGTVSVLSLLLPFSLNPSWGISEAYFWQWAEGQSKVLGLLLILLAFYFGSRKRPVLSGIFLGLSFYDPRFALISIPLFLALNKEKRKLLLAGATTAAVMIVTNIPFLLLPGVVPSFIEMLSSGGLMTPIYPYAYIPLVAVVSLSIARWKEIWLVLSRTGRPVKT